MLQPTPSGRHLRIVDHDGQPLLPPAAVVPGAPVAEPVEFTRLISKLYQGSRPPLGHAVRQTGFDVLVLCAVEFQPLPESFPGVHVVRARIDDSGAPFTAQEWNEARAAAGHVASAVRHQHRVLVTCMQGRNRSGLVAAIALHMLTGKPGKECVKYIRSMRGPLALGNPSFVAAIETLR